jgi:ATP-dependent exoDNAse (exonuclease V) beta subunit
LNNSFTIYNASAGSGKTFTLVKEYLKILLRSPNPNKFKQILAITFTNKAVNEMKERIMDRLEDFTKEKTLQADSTMFEIIASDLNLEAQEMQIRAGKILKHILHNYAFFDIVTIDKFNHRLLRTFAFDLKLPLNFEVVIEEQLLLEEVTDKLIFKAGTDKLLTNVLLDFALEKADNDKSWDISNDLYRIAKLLLKENYLIQLETIQNVSLKQLQATAKQLKKQLLILEKEAVAIGKTTLETIAKNNIEFDDFTRGSLPKFFKKIADGNLAVGFETKWQQDIDTEKLYTSKKANTDAAATIDALQPWLAKQHEAVKITISKLKYRQNFLKNLTPLSLLSAINSLLQEVKEDENLLLISEFNKIISKEIGIQPAPFIYERIGEKYRHYFIDEFQDTSRMQWENLTPLISNALESETPSGQKGTLMLVGDAKQAIYRWRGGVAEQFMALYDTAEGKNPFQIEKNVFSLPRNHRSCEEIVNFNNKFFQHIATHLSDRHYKSLFKDHSLQQTNRRTNGYVQISFVEKDITENKKIAYCQLVYTTILELIKEGKSLKDICILTRKKREGVAIASFLNEKNIPIISSESLLLKNDRRIQFLINLIRHAIHPQNKEIAALLLLFIGENENHIHETMSAYLDNIEDAFKNYNFQPVNFQKLPFAEAIEYAIKSFNLQKDSDAYLQYFLDEILDYSIHNNVSFTDFLAFWEKKEDSLSIVSPSAANAIKIMTIHKAKGLEFPIVIYPFADSKVNEDLDRELWLPVSQEEFGIQTALFTRNKDLASYNDFTKQMCEAQEAKLQLDQYNILYVALTRAVEQLYIFTTKEIAAKGQENINTYSGLFINYLKELALWNEATNTYIFGKKPSGVTQKEPVNEKIIPFAAQNPLQRSFKVITKGGSLWETTRETALEKGNLYHVLLSQVKYKNDLEEVLEEALLNGDLSENMLTDVSKRLQQLIRHPELSNYFTTNYTIYNEQDIYTFDGQIIRPDRLVADSGNNAIIIDYKTGAFKNDHINQLNTYENAVTQMGFHVQKKLLVFINESIEVKVT